MPTGITPRYSTIGHSCKSYAHSKAWFASHDPLLYMQGTGGAAAGVDIAGGGPGRGNHFYTGQRRGQAWHALGIMDEVRVTGVWAC